MKIKYYNPTQHLHPRNNNPMLLIVFVLLGLLYQRVESACSGGTPYEYSGSCYADCSATPVTTYLFETDSTCRESMFFDNEGCPFPDYFADDVNGKCVTGIHFLIIFRLSKYSDKHL